MNKTECTECNGNGYITWEINVPHNFGRDIGYIDTDTSECNECAGYGWVPTQKKTPETS